MTYFFPSLLHICRAIRIEVAYLYYTSTPFSFTVRNLDFSIATHWLDTLPVRHRELLARNKGLEIVIVPELKQSFTYLPDGWLLDKPVDEHWRDCKPYGNLYTLPSHNRVHFVLFCRLKKWFDGCRDLRWKYTFDTVAAKGRFWGQNVDGDIMLEFLMVQVRVISSESVGRTWTRGRIGGRGKDEARRFLEDLERGFKDVGEGRDRSVVWEWGKEMTRVREAVERW